MDYGYSDLGHLSAGQIVEVRLSGNAANVLLLDSANFSSYRRGRSYRYHGGHVKRSPYRIAVPHSGHWYVAVDLGGYAGRTRWSVSVFPGALPPARQSLPFGNGDDAETAAELVEETDDTSDQPEVDAREESVS
jgi:hypothetical protein